MNGQENVKIISMDTIQAEEVKWLWYPGSLTPKNFEITRKASNGFIFLSNLYFLLPRYS